MGAPKNNPFSNATAGQTGDNSGVSGVTQTNGKYQSVPQIDPTEALNYYAQAGQVMSEGVKTGNDAYQAALTTAAGQMTEGFANANTELKPLSDASNQALALYQRMLGITPTSATSEYANKLLTIDPTLTSTADLINQANSTADPDQAKAIQNQITNSLQQVGSQGVTAAQSAISALGAVPTVTPALSDNQAATQALSTGFTGIGKLQTDAQSLVDNSTAVNAQQTAASGAYQAAQATDQTAYTQALAQQASLNQFDQQFNQAYQPAQPGFTGQEITNQLASTPGYQFTLDQGNQQVLRNQAAVGNLGTGATQVALANYGQNLAQNTYNGYMSNLANLINVGIPATTQIAANQANQGGYLANLTQLGGQANNAAAQGEANAIGQADNNQAATSYNAAAMNTQLQYNAWAANQTKAATDAANSMNLAQGAQQTATNNASGAGFYQGMNAVVNNGMNSSNGSGGSTVQSNGGAV
jgi:hypothetical protein